MTTTLERPVLGRISGSIPDFDAALAKVDPDKITGFGMIRNPLKIYILIRESIDVGHAVNCAAHASLQLYLNNWHEDLVTEWATKSFRKVSCKVTDAEFEEAKKYGGYELVTESKLPEPEVALAFLPKREWEPFFKTLKLYS